MFEAISVSQRTRKPWTVAVSMLGQVAMIGLAILVPLVSTEGLPHPLGWVTVPEPPRALPHRAAPAAVKPVRTVPFLMKTSTLFQPRTIPDKPVMIQDPDIAFTPGDAGVPGGIGNSNGPGHGVIDSLVRSATPPPPPPPAPAAKPTAPAPIPRIRLGGQVVEGKLVSGPQPVYPPLARAARISGVVRLQAVISREGTILDLHAVSGHPLLIPAALAAVKQWIFRPTSLNGEPVEVATEIEVNFTLR
ncbi:MAG TPA: energy transducer TonB [Bryobacteraceae bacterium]|nr:energy transducer TonB [Bryobacteraceae bacterium]